MDEVMVSFLQEITAYTFAMVFLFQIKHFFADFIFQTPYMLGKFKASGWLMPLIAHCATHALFTFHLILWLYLSVGDLSGFEGFYTSSEVVWISASAAGFDFVSHFFMDFIKARPFLLGRFQALTKDTFPSATEEQKRGNKYFWWSLGFDQLWHKSSDLLIICWAVNNVYYG